jgi:hypothetical protein
MPVIVNKYGGGRQPVSLQFDTIAGAAKYLRTTPATVAAWAKRPDGLAPDTGEMKTAVILTGKHADRAVKRTAEKRKKTASEAPKRSDSIAVLWMCLAIAEAAIIGVLLL